MTAVILLAAITTMVSAAGTAPISADPAGASALVDTQLISNEREIREAWSDAVRKEAYVAEWAPEWKHPVARASVAEALSKSLAVLRNAGQENVELLLAVGLTARWAHNVDLDGTFEVGVGALKKAQALAPQDPRAEWFLGTSLCQTPEDTVAGMTHLLAVERRTPGTQLGALFWREYVDCAGKTFLPAHALRARQMLVRSGRATDFEKRQQGEARKLVLRATEADEIAQADAWKATKCDARWSLASIPCGFQLEVGGDDKIELRPASKGSCFAQVELQEGKGRKGPSASVAVVVRMRHENETLASFVEARTKGLERRPSSRTACPAASCMNFEVVNPRWHPEHGGGTMVATAFERPEPEFPGLATEQPRAVQQSEGAIGKTTYFIPIPRLSRYRGTLYYLVFLDSALPVSSEARAGYERLLKTLVVD